jgi:prepilin-type N-terminal cleavage/methylation domain-containing protein
MQATLERLRERRDERGDEGGFTLIELLIVIVILGILAAIVVFAVENLTSQSTVSACQATYKTTETAYEAYDAQVGSYPSTLSALTGQQTGLNGQLDGPWLKDLPPVYTPASAGPPPVAASVNPTGPYGIYIANTTTGTLGVGTIKANGATTDSNGASMTDCTNA